MREIHQPPTGEAFLQAVRSTENQYENQLREDFLVNHFYHDHVLSRFLSRPGGDKDLARVRENFIAQKVGKNMGQRLELALSNDYFDIVNVVELAATEHISRADEVDCFKDEYEQLRQWLIAHRRTEGELSREESGRSVHFRAPIYPEADKSRIIAIRKRPLLIGGQGTIRFGIWKRMVFSLPHGTGVALSNLRLRSGEIDQNGVNKAVEFLLDRRDPIVDPIRTSYYVASHSMAEINHPDFQDIEGYSE